MSFPTCENTPLYFFEAVPAINERLTAQIQFNRLPYSKARFKAISVFDKTPGLTLPQIFELLDGELNGLPAQLTTWQAVYLLQASRALLPDYMPLETMLTDVPEALTLVNDLTAGHGIGEDDQQTLILLQTILNRLQHFYTLLMQKSILGV